VICNWCGEVTHVDPCVMCGRGVNDHPPGGSPERSVGLAAAISDGAIHVASAIHRFRSDVLRRLARIERRLAWFECVARLQKPTVRSSDSGNSPLPAGPACSEPAGPAFCHVCGTTETEGEPIRLWVLVCPTCAGSIIHAQAHDQGVTGADPWIDPEDP